MIEDWRFYLFAAPAVILVGLSKGGFSGLAVISTPLVALVVPPVQAAAIMLPILIVQDMVSVLAYRKSFDRRNVTVLLPGSAFGIFLGWLFAARVTEGAVRLLVGAIAVGFVSWIVWRRRHTAKPPAARPSVRAGLFWGAASGFTSFVSHAGGPPFQVYVMPQRLPPEVYAGTNTMVFTVTNLLKVIPYMALGQFSAQNLSTSAALAPLAIVATMAGVWLVRRIPAGRFYDIVYALTFLVGLKLVFDGARATF